MWFLAGMGETELGVDNATNVWGIILRALRSVFYEINSLIYKLMIYLYQLFETICNARFLDNDTFNQLATRVGMILGVIMLFSVMFSFIQMLIDPNRLEDKDKGAIAIIKKCLLVVVMLGMSSFFFDSLYYIQKYVIQQKIIYRLLLPSDVAIDTDNFGAVLAARTFSSFYTVEDSFKKTGSDEGVQCENVRSRLIRDVIYENNFSTGSYCLNAWGTLEISESDIVKEIDGFIMDYNFLLQALCGVAFVYLLFNYVFKVGVRVIQLTVLQIISPMAIVGYLSPKQDNMFKKWWDVYFSTYIDVFIRMAIIYFMVYLSAILLDSLESGTSTFWDSVGNPSDFGTRSIIVLVMIFALLTFAKKAPDLLKQLFPSGESKLGFGASMKDIVGLNKGLSTAAGIGTGAAVGLIAGAAGGRGLGRLTGALGGATGGVFRGGHAGFGAKGIGSAIGSARKNQAEYSKKMADIRANGGTWLGSKISGLQGTLGMRTAYDRMNDQYDEEKEYTDAYSAMKSKADSEVDKHLANYKYQYTDASGTAHTLTLAELNKMRTDSDHYTSSEMAKYEEIYNQIHGYARDQAMTNGGALKDSGSMTWKAVDDGAGGIDWSRTESSRIDSNIVGNIATNAEIQANMQKVLSSSVARSATGSNFARAKAANDYYEAHLSNKINDDAYQRAKANSNK